MGQYCFARWCMLSAVCRRCLLSSVPTGGQAGRRARGRSVGRHCTAGQYGYVPLGRHLVLKVIVRIYTPTCRLDWCLYLVGNEPNRLATIHVEAPARAPTSSVTGCRDVHDCVRDQASNVIFYTTTTVWMRHPRQPAPPRSRLVTEPGRRYYRLISEMNLCPHDCWWTWTGAQQCMLARDTQQMSIISCICHLGLSWVAPGLSHSRFSI